LFGHLLVDELVLDNLDILIENAYAEIGTFLNSTPYVHVFRFWNYIPDINRVEHGIERYQAFCVGRHAAVSLHPDFEQTLPAASAVGTEVPGLLISFASGKVRPIQVENQRQISAFHYPSVYGPRSPLFSRAVCMNWNIGEQQLYISGTASIVGHETRHTGDVTAQALETCKNLDAVIEEFSFCSNKADANNLPAGSLRVYLRHPEQLGVVQNILSLKRELPANIIYLKGDLCRAGLLLEIEGIFSLAGSAASG
jgi:chorismate lyase/3-hydroxybenzoate synthase